MSNTQKVTFEELEIVDGLVVINGLTACVKAMSAVCVSVCAVNNTSSERKQYVLAISETNNAVDSLTQEFYQFITNPKEPGEARQHLVVRLLPLEEINAVKTRMIPKENKVNILSDDEDGDFKQLLSLLPRIRNQQKLEFKEKAVLKDLLQRLYLLNISKADIVVCTIVMAIRPKIAKLLGEQVTHILMNDGAKIGSGHLISIIAKYPKLDFLLVEGDRFQQTPYTRTHLNPEFPNFFSHVLKESALEIAMQLTSHNACLVHQHRMWTQDLCGFISRQFYSGRLRDGNEKKKKKKKPIEFEFCNAFIKDILNAETKGNFVMFHIESRDTVQKVGTSRTNQHHQMTALDLIKKLIFAVDINKFGVDKPSFKIEYLSGYKAQVHEMNVLIKTLGDNRVNAKNCVSSVRKLIIGPMRNALAMWSNIVPHTVVMITWREIVLKAKTELLKVVVSNTLEVSTEIDEIYDDLDLEVREEVEEVNAGEGAVDGTKEVVAVREEANDSFVDDGA